MGRKLRPYLPGGFFHIASRLQDHFRYFDDVLSERSIEIIGDAETRCDARVWAHAIMPTHLHLIVQQGCNPLSRLMQPILRRIAHQVKQAHGTEGHAVERPYGAVVCESPVHLRDAITYVHLNGVRANMCAGPEEYRWTSHAEYLGRRAGFSVPAPDVVAEALSLFAGTDCGDISRLRQEYATYVQWRIASDQWNAAFAAGLPVSARPDCPSTAAGDAKWFPAMSNFNSAAPTTPRARADLRDVLAHQLARILPEATLDMVRQGWLSRYLMEIRNQLIWSALLAGYSGVEIAQFLNIAESTVTRVSRAGPPRRRTPDP